MVFVVLLLLNLDLKLCHRCPGIESHLAGQLLQVGVDFAEGFTTKNGRKHTKHYLCVLTCLAVCAVHLEVVFGLETDLFLLAFTRFTSRCLTPKSVHSDKRHKFCRS